MATTAELVREILERELGADASDLKTSPEGRVSGFVVATAFSGKDPMERQHLVRDLLRSRLPEGTMRSVGLLMTVTPSELAAALEDD